ncbi:MAG TPA: MFS transporter, partial [Solirubrobacteraceae bacterium]|nr:MFS transporter [Solirubrobacteraceae bacterium]
LLSEAFPAGRRGLVLGLWSGISGLAVAIGPLVGGAVVDGISWHWIFWINVPIGIALVPLAIAFLSESHGPAKHLDLPGLALGGLGLLGVVYGIVRGNELGWTSTEILGSLIAGVVLVAAFVAWELRAPHPMLPMRFFRSRTFAAANGVGFVMSFGVFGSIFLLAPFLQVTQGLSPLEAGIRTLPWTAMPMLIAPWAGILSDRIGSRPLMATGLALQAGALAWLASISVPDVAYSSLVIPFAMAGAGMALVFAPSANAVLGSVDQRSAGQASGATNAIRELGGVMGIAVLASVFSAHGSYASPQAYTDGMVSAVWVGAAVLAAGALVALLIPRVAGRATAPAAAPPIQAAPEPVAA